MNTDEEKREDVKRRRREERSWEKQEKRSYIL
jgi:hypothetical protein